MKSNIYIIGCGGVGSFITPALCLLTSPEQITLIDGDTLEYSNLNRQLFSGEDVGDNKAEALARRYCCDWRPEWFVDGLVDLINTDWLIVCVDNHAARKSALASCDRFGCQAIFAANETNSAESYFYKRDWKGTELDPRTYYSDILTDSSGDPRRAAIGCTGEAQKENPQLVTSNLIAAGLAGHLFSLWYKYAPDMPKSTIKHLPYLLRANKTRLETLLIRDTMKNQPSTVMKGPDCE